ELVVTDEAGNQTTVIFTIDKTAPVVEGVTDRASYNSDVTVTFNEGTATLNGEPFTSGETVTDDGNYRLIVTDEAGNQTVVDFTVERMVPDTTPPVITGVEDGKIYDRAVTPTINEGT